MYKKINLPEQLILLAQGLPTDMPATQILRWAREAYGTPRKARSKASRKIKGAVVFLDRLYALEDLRTVPGTPPK